MAKPQFFISSTYYDLKTVREDISRFLREIGYETIRHETGAVPYSRGERLDHSCYREVENCDVLVCIIGGRFGTASSTSHGSITQTELRSAHEQGKQVYIFIDRSVHSDWLFYQNNRGNDTVKYSMVNDKRIFDFIDEINKLPLGNPIFPFETSADIISLLREQLAGLFQRLLGESAQREQRRLFEELRASIATVGELTRALAEQKNLNSEVIDQILITDHPIFAALKRTLKIKYRIFFTNLTELDEWLSAARSLQPVDEVLMGSSEMIEWMRTDERSQGEIYQSVLKINRGLFDENGRLKQLSKSAWDDGFVIYTRTKIGLDEDEIPF